jgi:hypothetical protein
MTKIERVRVISGRYTLNAGEGTAATKLEATGRRASVVVEVHGPSRRDFTGANRRLADTTRSDRNTK